MVRAFEKVLELPYGENPHQRAAYYSQVGTRTHVLSMISQLGGKELSFNNLLDLDAGRLSISEFQIPACAIVKHNNPCGVAVGKTGLEAYQKAFACDPHVRLRRRRLPQPPRRSRARRGASSAQFVEVLFARGYDEDALEVLETKPNMRILDDRERRNPDMIDPAPAPGRRRHARPGPRLRPRGARARCRSSPSACRPRPSGASCSFAWKVCKHVRSNAIVILCRDLATVGIGAGQMSRVDSVRLAIEKSHVRRLQRHRRSPPTPSSPSPTAPSWRSTRASIAIIQPGGSDPRPGGRRGGRRRRRGDGLHLAPALPPLRFAGAPGATRPRSLAI